MAQENPRFHFCSIQHTGSIIFATRCKFATERYCARVFEMVLNKTTLKFVVFSLKAESVILSQWLCPDNGSSLLKPSSSKPRTPDATLLSLNNMRRHASRISSTAPSFKIFAIESLCNSVLQFLGF